MIKSLPLTLLLLLVLSTSVPTLFAAEPISDVPFDQEYRDAFIQLEVEGEKREPRETAVHAVTIAKDGTVWVATAQGLRVVQSHEFHNPQGVTIDGPTFDVTTAADGTIWVGAWDGLHKISNGRATRIAGLDGPVNLVRQIGDRLLAGNPSGLWESAGSGWKKIESDWTPPIVDLAKADGDLYVATISGAYHVTDDGIVSLSADQKLLSRNVRALAVSPRGEILVGSRGGIDVFRNGKHISSWTGKEGLPSTDVRSLSYDEDGVLWVGTGLGVARFDGESWSLRHSLRWLPSNDVRDVTFAPAGTAWVATGDGIGVIRSRQMTLADKAQHYQEMVRARHVRPPGLMERCRLATPGDVSTFEPMDTDNDGLFTGLYLAGESYRFAVTGAADAKANAQEAYRAMEFLQTVTGTDGFVARTVVPPDWEKVADGNRTYTDEEVAARKAREPRWKKVEQRWRLSADGKWQWKGDTSSDETSGHFYSYGLYYDLVADEKEKQRVATHVAKIMDYIIDGGYVFRDIDGESTRWAVWSQEKLNDDPDWWLERGVNSVEILSYLTVTRHVTGDAKYDREIEKLLKEHHYAENIQQPIDPSADYFTYIGMQLLAMSYPALLNYEDDPERRELYLKSLETWFDSVRDDASPFYGFTYGAFSEGDFKQQACVDLLRDVPLDQIEWTVDNTQREDITLVGRPAEGRVQTSRLLPPSEKGIFRWDRNVHEARRGSEGKAEGSSAFWLTPYWMGRYHGFISKP